MIVGGQRTAWRGSAFPLVVAAALGLGLGLMVYMADRSPARVALLPALLAIGGDPLFGPLGLWLPSFVHPFAFSLLTVALRAPGARPACGACLGWWVVNVVFEFGQHPGVAPRVVEAVQALGIDERLTRPLTGYLLHGTFDVGDLGAATLGALAAAAVVRVFHRPEVRDVS